MYPLSPLSPLANIHSADLLWALKNDFQSAVDDLDDDALIEIAISAAQDMANLIREVGYDGDDYDGDDYDGDSDLATIDNDYLAAADEVM